MAGFLALCCRHPPAVGSKHFLRQWSGGHRPSGKEKSRFVINPPPPSSTVRERVRPGVWSHSSIISLGFASKGAAPTKRTTQLPIYIVYEEVDAHEPGMLAPNATCIRTRECAVDRMSSRDSGRQASAGGQPPARCPKVLLKYLTTPTRSSGGY